MLLLTACFDSSNQTPTPDNAATIVDIDASDDCTKSVDARQSSAKLQIISESPWTLNVSDTRGSVNWLAPSVTAGEAGRCTVTFDIEENTSSNSRVAYVHISNSENDVMISFTQEHYSSANLSVSQNEISVESAAIKERFTLKSDIEWTLTSDDESFCTVSPIRGSAGEYTISVSITENTSENTKRSTTLTACAGYEKVMITVIQNRKKPELNYERGIRTLDDLCRFRDAVNAGESLAEWKYNGEINLLADIDLSYIDNWIPIGNTSHHFCEVFNGNGFEIKNMTCISGKSGLFGICDGGTIKNTNLIGVYSESNGICYELRSSKSGNLPRIINCSIDGYVRSGAFCGEEYKDYYKNYENPEITDCTNYSVCSSLISSGHHYSIMKGCANYGAYVESQEVDEGGDWIDSSEDQGYLISQTLHTELGGKIKNIKEFKTYLQQQTEFTIEGLNYYNDNSIALLYNVRKLSIKSGNPMNYNIDLNRKAAQIINNYFPDLTELTCEFNYYGYLNYYTGIAIDLDSKPHLDILSIIASNTPNSGAHVYFTGTSNLSTLKISALYSPNSSHFPECRYLTIRYDGSYLSNLPDKLEYLDCSKSLVHSVDISNTNLNNSTYDHPLKCNNCGFSRYGSYFSLTMKSGWEIEGINKNRSTDYIDSYADIIYKD